MSCGVVWLQVNMVITQPRRISTISVAERIAFERAEPIGRSTGYHVRLEAKKSGGALLLAGGGGIRQFQCMHYICSHVFVSC